MNPLSSAAPDRRSLVEIEVEARRMRAQVIRAAGIAIGKSLARLFSRDGGRRRPV